MNEFKTPELSSEDSAIEVYVSELILKRHRNALSIQKLEAEDEVLLMCTNWSEAWRITEQATIRSLEIEEELKRLTAAQEEINALLSPPDMSYLWTSDECSAAIVEEWNHDAIKEVERLRAELSDFSDYCSDYGWAVNLSEKYAVMESELEEAIEWRDRLQVSLARNPKAGYLPF